MGKLDKDQVIAAFTEAYTAAHGKAPTVEAKGGWYSVDGGKNIRLAELNEMITSLSAATTAAQPKKSVASKKPAAKKKTSSKAKKSDFSVKAFWASKILEHNADSKTPR